MGHAQGRGRKRVDPETQRHQTTTDSRQTGSTTTQTNTAEWTMISIR